MWSPMVRAVPGSIQVQIKEAASYFEQQLAADGRAPGTVAQRVRHVRAFAAWMGREGHGGEMGAVTAQVIAEYVGHLIAPSLAGTIPARRTANSVRSSLRQFFGYLEALGVVEGSPARVLRNAPVPNSGRVYGRRSLEREVEGDRTVVRRLW